MAGVDEAALRTLAISVVQGANEDYDPPLHLLSQLRELIAVRPHDTLFKIDARAGKGYGIAYCLEEKCKSQNKNFVLTKQSGVSSASGIGNLFHLTWHQTESSTHKKAIKTRLAANTVDTAPSAPIAPLSATTSSSKPLPSQHVRKNSLAKAGSSNSLKRPVQAVIVIDDSEDENEDPAAAPSPARKNGQASFSGIRSKNVPSSPGKAPGTSTSLRQMEAHESQEREKKKRRLSEASSLSKIAVKDEERDDDASMQIDLPQSKSRTNSAFGQAGPSKPSLFHPHAKQESDDEEMKPLSRKTSSHSTSDKKASSSTSMSNEPNWITLPTIKRAPSPISLEDSDAEDVKPSLAALKGKGKMPASKIKAEEDEDEASQPAFAAVSTKTITLKEQRRLDADLSLKQKQLFKLIHDNRQARALLRQKQQSGMGPTAQLEAEIDTRDADMRSLEKEMRDIERELQYTVVKDEVMDEEVDELMSEKEDIKPKIKNDDSDEEMLPDIKTSFVSRPKIVKQTSLNRQWGNIGGEAGPSSERSNSASSSSAKARPKFEEDSDDEDKKDVKPKIDSDDEDDAIMRDLAEAGKNVVMGFDPLAAAADDEDLEGVDPHLKDFLRSSKHMQDFESETSVEDAMAVLGLSSLTDKLKNTNISLYAHQVLGVKWALAQEAHKKYKGGIIADEMGLGKTVQMISIISQNQSDDPKEKSTLILAPLGLLQQWKEEIESKTQGKLSVYLYHGPDKTRSLKELRRYDVVLTTLTTMSREWVPDDSLALKRKKAAMAKKGHVWTEDDDIKWYDDLHQDGILFKNTWHRIVIDEAQNIRNRDTTGSRAVHGLKSEYRWCLSGTPVTNSLTDVYALFRFLRIKPGNEWDWFRKQVYLLEKKRPDIAGKRVQAILKHCCIRRNKNSELNGKRLITLPDKHVNLVTLDFTEEEREIYNFVETKSQQRINRYLKEGSLTKNYANILVMLLRLRQLCGHASLIAEDVMNAAFEDPEAEKKEKQRKLNNAIATMGQTVVHRLQAERLKVAIEQANKAKDKKKEDDDDEEEQEIAMEECQICFNNLSDGIPLVTKCGHIFCSPCLHEYMTEVQAHEMADGGDNAVAGADPNKQKTCPKCRQMITLGTSFQMSLFEPDDEEVARITKQKFVRGKDNYDQELKELYERQGAKVAEKKSKKKKSKATKTITLSSDEDEDMQDDKKPEPRKNSSKSKKSRAARNRVLADSDDEGSNAGSDNAYDSEDSFIDDSGIGGQGMKKKSKGKGRATRDESEDDIESADSELDSDVLDDDDRLINKNNAKAAFKALENSRKVIPSTKLTHNLKLVTEAPVEDKFMIVSQWTTMLDLTAAHLKEKGITFLRFQGDMSRNARDDAVKKFNTSPKYKCLLMSLKAGGVGLTLTGGNRVVFLDLAWNPATELQAMDRLHRISQRKEVFVSRLVIRNSVEDRILALQERKQGLADAALGEGKGGKIGKLSVKQLKQLFGMVPMNPLPGGAENN